MQTMLYTSRHQSVTAEATPATPAQEVAIGSGKADALEAGDTDTNVQSSIDRRSDDLVSQTSSQETAAGTKPKDKALVDTGTATPVKCEDSVAKRRRSLRKPSTTASVIAMTPKDSGTASRPLESAPPSQDTVPVRRSIVKDLANFFSGGSTKPRNMAPIRSDGPGIGTDSIGKRFSVASTTPAGL
ncbi:hypothetical protein LTS17_004044 [Exophiala oligosperma]